MSRPSRPAGTCPDEARNRPVHAAAGRPGIGHETDAVHRHVLYQLRENPKKHPVFRSVNVRCSQRFGNVFTVNETASQNGEEFGFQSGDIVQEWLWDDDVDDSLRAKIEDLTGEDLVDEDYDSAVDGAIVWWRDGDDEDELSDTSWTPIRSSAMMALSGC